MAVIASASTPSCVLESDECVEGEARCDGAIARVCRGEVHGSRVINVWHSDDCGDRVCLAAADPRGMPQAFCALSLEPDVRCTEPEGASCDGKLLVQCRAGRAVDISACSGTCISLDDMTDYCADNPPNEARCVSGDGCEMASTGFSATSGQAPGATCSITHFGPVTDPSTKIYAYRCVNGLLTARNRCDNACVSTAACTTHCE
ncbi:MAG: hypothetical protein ACOY0T_32730 [Myxococcota bacterium]